MSQAKALSEQIIERVDTAAEALKNINDIQDVDIATAQREVVWNDGKLKLYHFHREGEAKALEITPDSRAGR